MSTKNHNTQKPHGLQALNEAPSYWSEEVVVRLPARLEKAARDHKAFQRRRGLQSASDLLRAILSYVLGVMSVREWGAWAVTLGLANISETAWRKHLRKANAWLLWILNELLAAPAWDSALVTQSAQRILLVDATRLRQPGGTGDDWRLHLAYDLRAGQFAQIQLTDFHKAEQLDYYSLQKGDIVVTDAGYGIRRNVAQLFQQQADGIIRIFPTTFPVEDEQGQPINLFTWLRQPGTAVREWTVFFKDETGQRSSIRVVAGALPDEKAELARFRKRKVAQKHGRSISEDTLLAAGWVILVSTLPANPWQAHDILSLYRARWQIELVFKRMKQILKLNQLRCKKRESVEPCIRALLIAWVLQEQEVTQLRSCLSLLTQTHSRISSTWLTTKLSLATLRQQVIGHWCQAQVDAALPKLLRFLTTPFRNKRQHQETTVRDWLIHRFTPSPITS